MSGHHQEQVDSLQQHHQHPRLCTFSIWKPKQQRAKECRNPVDEINPNKLFCFDHLPLGTTVTPHAHRMAMT